MNAGLMMQLPSAISGRSARRWSSVPVARTISPATATVSRWGLGTKNRPISS